MSFDTKMTPYITVEDDACELISFMWRFGRKAAILFKALQQRHSPAPLLGQLVGYPKYLTVRLFTCRPRNNRFKGVIWCVCYWNARLYYACVYAIGMLGYGMLVCMLLECYANAKCVCYWNFRLCYAYVYVIRSDVK